MTAQDKLKKDVSGKQSAGAENKGSLEQLTELGQSLWYDYIRRDLIRGGKLKSLIGEDSLRGMTTNPSIFENAIAESDLYDEGIRQCNPELDTKSLYEVLAFRDVRKAADVFRPLYQKTEGRDGFVSIEVEPSLAYDTEKTLADARRLWRACGRPNVMIKIPGTQEGLAAIEACLAEGINVNVTLLFSVERYEQVMEAWLKALEQRAKREEPLDRVASVASFFVSRLDTLVDKLLKENPAFGKDDEAKGLLGKTGVDNARLAYQAFRKISAGDRFQALKEKGARLQRPLWASTSTKNPDLPDTFYVEALIGADTVNTLPPKTFEAYKDHGKPSARLEDDLDGMRRRLEKLKKFDIDLASVTKDLEKEGVKKFEDSFAGLLKALESKTRAVRAA